MVKQIGYIQSGFGYTPERLQSTLGFCRGSCSLGITQMDAGNALHLQKLGLMPDLGGAAETIMVPSINQTPVVSL